MGAWAARRDISSNPAPGASTAQYEADMSKQVNRASAIAIGATLITILIGANGSGASAQSKTPVEIKEEPAQPLSQLNVQPLPGATAAAAVDTADSEEPHAASLAALVATQPQQAELPRELNCLAGAIYFEAKSEPLAGQLAVGRVIVARSKSGRFPNSYCGVVFQPSQFSFVRGGTFPAINRKSAQWHNAVALAQISHEGSWRSPVEGALYFHAASVSPGWRMKRLGRVENHVFYR